MNRKLKALILIATLSMAFTAQFAIASPADDFMNGFGDDFMDDAMKAVEKKIEESRAEESVPVEEDLSLAGWVTLISRHIFLR
jgi:hypothetical protein